jgi:hypothetical protein
LQAGIKKYDQLSTIGNNGLIICIDDQTSEPISIHIGTPFSLMRFLILERKDRKYKLRFCNVFSEMEQRLKLGISDLFMQDLQEGEE